MEVRKQTIHNVSLRKETLLGWEKNKSLKTTINIPEKSITSMVHKIDAKKLTLHFF